MFLYTLKQKAFEKLQRFPGLFDASAMKSAPTLYEFDNLFTAPLHGYRNTDDYWLRASSKPRLAGVQTPTLVINALNDPFVPASCLPGIDQVSSAVRLLYTAQGGHVGFTNGLPPGRLQWLPNTILAWFKHG
jgi:predicted alpha/beta-fold hydrolase